MGRGICQWTFERSLPSHGDSIRQMEAGTISVSSRLQRFPQAEGHDAYGVFAYRSTDGVLTVEFWCGKGFSPMHSG